MKTGKSTKIFLLALALLLAGNISQLAAKEETDPALEAAADQYNNNKSNPKYKVVCKREAPVGTRIKRKVCRTVATIENAQRQAKESMDRLRTAVGDQQ